MRGTRWLPFEWVVAIRFLQEGKIQTGFIAVGIAIGVAVIVFMSALLAGLQSNFVNRVLTGQAHIQLLNHKEAVRPLRDGLAGEGRELAQIQVPLQRQKGIDQWQSWATQLRRIPEVRVLSPSVTGAALASRGSATRSVSVVGVQPEVYFQIIPMPEKIVQGQALINSESILIGTELASDLGLGVGDKLRLSSGTGRVQTLTVSGIFDLGNKAANTRNTFVALRTAQTLFDLVGIASVLVVSVVQRSREIGILRAMGVTRGQVLRVFLIQGGLLGLGGAVLGSGIGALALFLWQRFMRNADGSVMFPLVFDSGLLLQTLLLATLTGLLSAFAPALRAARLDPVVAIRG